MSTRQIELRFQPGDLPVSLNQGETATVGRHPRCAITLAHPLVSREHFALDFSGADCVIRSCDSGGALFVNGQPVGTEGRVLAAGDTVSLGALAATALLR